MKKNTLYVAYGSNLNLIQMGQRCPTAAVYGIGRITDYRLTFKALGAYAYATIEPCQGEYVPVAVWKIGVADESSLDRYEGYPTHYKKEMVEVVLEDSVIMGMVYIMNELAVPAFPTQGYFECIMSGYRSLHLEEQKLLDAWYGVKGETLATGSALKYHRQKRGLTQRQLAEISGVSLKSIENYEQGERSIARARADTLLRLAQALGVTPYLLSK